MARASNAPGGSFSGDLKFAAGLGVAVAVLAGDLGAFLPTFFAAAGVAAYRDLKRGEWGPSLGDIPPDKVKDHIKK